MASKELFVEMFMRRTAKLRAIFGPAQQGSLEGRVVYDGMPHRFSAKNNYSSGPRCAIQTAHPIW